MPFVLATVNITIEKGKEASTVIIKVMLTFLETKMLGCVQDSTKLLYKFNIVRFPFTRPRTMNLMATFIHNFIRCMYLTLVKVSLTHSQKTFRHSQRLMRARPK